MYKFRGVQKNTLAGCEMLNRKFVNWLKENLELEEWIPAFAGMTKPHVNRGAQYFLRLLRPTKEASQ